MIGIVMAGGRGSRMRLHGEKLLLWYKKPVILHVLDALINSGCFSQVFAATSPNSPQTRDLVSKNYDIIKTPGCGYAADLNYALRSLDSPVFVAPADLPLLDDIIVKRVAKYYNPQTSWLSILVTKRFRDSLKLSSGLETDAMHDGMPCVYTGISLVNSAKVVNLRKIREDYIIIDDKRLAFNLNTKQDYDLLDAA